MEQKELRTIYCEAVIMGISRDEFYSWVFDPMKIRDDSLIFDPPMTKPVEPWVANVNERLAHVREFKIKNGDSNWEYDNVPSMEIIIKLIKETTGAKIALKIMSLQPSKVYWGIDGKKMIELTLKCDCQ